MLYSIAIIITALIPKMTLRPVDTIADRLNSFFYKNLLSKPAAHSSSSPSRAYDSGLVIRETMQRLGESTPTNSRIIEMIEQCEAKTINEILANDQITSDSSALDLIATNIPAPLEQGDLIFLQFRPALIEILSSSLYLHLIMIYFTLMLIFIITCKFVLAKNISSSGGTRAALERIKSLPLGKYIHFILISLIRSWEKSSILWIYLLLLFLLFFSSFSAYGVYACLFVLKD